MKIEAVLRWRPGQYARNSVSLFGWMLVRAAAQVATVFLLARTLGAADYGQFVVVLAVASFLSPFVGLGLSNIVLRNGAMDPAHMPIYFGRALRWWLLTLVPGIVAACLFAWLLLPQGLPLWAAFAAIAADLCASSLTELRARHHQAQHRLNAYGAFNAGLPAIRLVALCLLFTKGNDPSTGAVLWTYAASSLGYTLALWLPVRTARDEGKAPEPMSAASGLPFSLATFAMRLQAEFNKPVLAHLGFDLAGAYNVAQRASDLASMPLSALQESLWPRLYAHSDPIQQLRRMGLLLLVLATACCTAIWLAAPLLPMVLGEDFAIAAEVLRYLAWLPLLQSIRAILNFHAIHAGRMNLIGWAYAVGAATSVVCTLLFVSSWGLNGAVAASYCSELAMIGWLVSSNKLTRRP